MKRLTERVKNCADPKEIDGDWWKKDPDYIREVNRFADYADTGLEPAQYENVKIIIESPFGDTSIVERIRELLKADKDGRVVVLPPNKALTNADCMRAATNQQLAKQIYDNQKKLCRMIYKNLGFEDELNFSEDYSDILAWLNAPSKEAEAALEVMEDGN